MDSLNDHQKDVYQQFLDISMFQTPSTEEEQLKLIQFLSSNDWILESSISNYFDQDNSIEVRDDFHNTSLPPPVPDTSTKPNQGLSSLIPQTNNPMMNDLLTRMRFPTILDISDSTIMYTFGQMVNQRRNIDKLLIRNGFFNTKKSIARNANINAMTNLGRLSLQIYESKLLLWVLWPLISALDLIWAGLKLLLGLKF